MESKRSYNDAPRGEDREELLANSDIDSSSTVNDNDWPTFKGSRPSKGRTFISALRDYWWLYSTGLLVVIAGLQLVILHEIRARPSDSSRQVGGDYTAQGPTCSLSVDPS